MNKDIIYIDTEDDITEIIGKIKASKDKIVALVPPKRTGVLQSAVNLRLLARMAKNGGKNLVIVTNNKALVALTAAAKIPVAKNLQSKPEIAEIAALEIDDGEDIIDGAQLPIGELVKTTDYTVASSDVDAPNQKDVVDDLGSINIDNEGPQYVPPSLANSLKPQPIGEKTVKSKLKVPDFPTFRKKLFLGIAVGILFIIFLIWANVYAPAATVIITTKTETAPVSMTLQLGGATATDLNKNIVQTVSKTIKKDLSVDFTATSQKDLGIKATGTVNVKNCDDTNPVLIPTGTRFTSSGGLVFTSTSVITVPGLSGSASLCKSSNATSSNSRDVSVQAEEAGATYNIPATYYTSAALTSTRVLSMNGTVMQNGTSRMATVVTQDDILKAGQALVDLSTNDVKQQLTKQFINGEKVISDSFNIDRADAVSAPVVGAEAIGGKAKLTSATTFTLTAIAKSELEAFLRNAINKQIATDNTQRVYDIGYDKVILSGYLKTDTGANVNIASTGKIGPNINPDNIKKLVGGKQFGDAQALITRIKGVSSVDIKFSYFWVNTVPTDVKKVDVKFILKDA